MSPFPLSMKSVPSIPNSFAHNPIVRKYIGSTCWDLCRYWRSSGSEACVQILQLVGLQETEINQVRSAMTNWLLPELETGERVVRRLLQLYSPFSASLHEIILSYIPGCAWLFADSAFADLFCSLYSLQLATTTVHECAD
jgi:hypothetical protein